MASDVDICNLALSWLGDDATVTNISPPEGSTQAEKCAIFYPVARDSLLSIHDWNFNTRRGTLTGVTLPTDITEWLYAYAKPNDSLSILEVMPVGITNENVGNAFTNMGYQQTNQTYINQPGGYTPQDFEIETDAIGNEIILCNVPNARARWTTRITDTSKFSPLFTDTLGNYLASYLAGPLLKGDVGRAEAKGQYGIAMTKMGFATVRDARQKYSTTSPSPAWINNRN